MKVRAVLTTLCALTALALTPTPALAAPGGLVGGDTFTSGGNRCVVAFNAHNPRGTHSVITAQPCAGSLGQAGVVAPPPLATPTATVHGSGGAPLTVHGNLEAPIGTVVCKYGPTSGWTCGTVQAKNLTVNFPSGTVTGLSRASMCSEPGDIGAPVVTTSGQAQGVVVGFSGNCGSGGFTYYQPVNQLLATYNLTLYTA